MHEFWFTSYDEVRIMDSDILSHRVSLQTLFLVMKELWMLG